MGELENPYRGRPSSSKVFFDQSKLVVVTGKSFGGFAGVASVKTVDPRISDVELGILVADAWDAKESVADYDEDAIDQSWALVGDAFEVDHYGELRYVAANRGADSIGVVPTEWKGDNRFFRPQDGQRLSLDVANAELGAAIRRAMELTVS